MNKLPWYFIVLAVILQACSSPAPVPPSPEAVSTATEPPTQQFVETSPTTKSVELSPATAPVEPSATPAVSKPPATAVINAGNFKQIAQVQAYYGVVENAVAEDFGADPFQMSRDSWTYSPDGKYLAIGGCTENWSGPCQSDLRASKSFLYVLDASTSEIVSKVPENNGTIYGLSFTPDNSRLVYVVCPLKAAVWNLTDQAVEQVLWQEKGCPSYPKLTVSPDGSQVALVSDTRLLIFDLSSGETITQLPAVREGSVFPKYSADGSRIAVFSAKDGKAITVYDTATWQVVSTITLADGVIQTATVDFSADGRWIVTAYTMENPDILLWDVETGMQAAVLDETFSYLDGLAFSPHGQLLLASGFGYNTDIQSNVLFSVWDVGARQWLGTIPGDTMSGRIMFDRNGETFLLGGEFGLARWSLPDEKMLAARTALTSMLDGLAAGDYATAAGWYQPIEEEQSALQAAGFDPTDLQETLEALCAQSHQPCALKYEITYSAKQPEGDYLFMVNFTAPDGSPYQDLYGNVSFGTFVSPSPDGSMHVAYLSSFFLP